MKFVIKDKDNFYIIGDDNQRIKRGGYGRLTIINIPDRSTTLLSTNTSNSNPYTKLPEILGTLNYIADYPDNAWYLRDNEWIKIPKKYITKIGDGEIYPQIQKLKENI